MDCTPAPATFSGMPVREFARAPDPQGHAAFAITRLPTIAMSAALRPRP
jgi:hypothetical protein